MRFNPKDAPWKKGQQSSSFGGDLIMRLRAEFRSAYMDTIDQAMVVEIIEEGTNRVIAKGSTVEFDERALRLDSTEMSSDKSYLFRYRFYEKSVIFKDDRNVLISGGHMGAVECNQPFIVQELTIMSKDLVKERANLYAHPIAAQIDTVNGRSVEHPISELTNFCKFD